MKRLRTLAAALALALTIAGAALAACPPSWETGTPDGGRKYCTLRAERIENFCLYDCVTVKAPL